MSSREDYIKGLHALADLLEANPDLELPYGTGTSRASGSRVTFYYLSDASAKDRLAEFARMIPGKISKETTDDTFRVSGQLHGLHLEAVAYRSKVCERVVTGQREVTRLVQDKPPTFREVTETVEDVEWVCAPILAESAS